MNERIQRADVISASFAFCWQIWIFKAIFPQKQRRCCWVKEPPSVGLYSILKATDMRPREAGVVTSLPLQAVAAAATAACRINKHRFSVLHLCEPTGTQREPFFNPVEVVE